MAAGEARQSEAPIEMTGAQAVIASLKREGVEHIFGYPGAQAMKIFDALYDSDIHFVLSRHEQAAVHEADGYARATGRAGVVVVTSGPGATNTVTGIATAYMDSIPLVVVTAQVPLSVIGTDSFQESDIFGITLPIVKHSYLLRDASELASTFKEAFHVAQTGRPGPVLIDVPSDIASQVLSFSYPDDVVMPTYKPTIKGNQKQVRQAVSLIESAQRPVIIAGGGVIVSGAHNQLLKLISRMRIPAVTTLMGKGCLPADDSLNLGPVGLHGSKYANDALTASDLIIAVGTHFSDRVTGKVEAFAPQAQLIHIDIDPAEIGKIIPAKVPIVGDAKRVLEDVNALLEKHDAQPCTEKWVETVSAWRARWPFYDAAVGDDEREIIPERIMSALSERLDRSSSIVVTDVGQHQMWAAQFVDRDAPRSFISSGGLGTMGFGLPAAIGAQIAQPAARVVCVTGDGSIQMNIQEMATAAEQGLPIAVLVMNNGVLGMVRQWQSLFAQRRFAATTLTRNPDFSLLAQAYGWTAERIERPEDVEGALDRMLACKGPYLLDVAISADQSVYPMIVPGGAMQDLVGAIDRDAGAVRTGLPQPAGDPAVYGYESETDSGSGCDRASAAEEGGVR